MSVWGCCRQGSGVTTGQMELARLRAEVACLRMEQDTAKKAPPPFRRARCKVCLDAPTEKTIPGEHLLRSAGGERQWGASSGSAAPTLLVHRRAMHAEIKGERVSGGSAPAPEDDATTWDKLIHQGIPL